MKSRTTPPSTADFAMTFKTSLAGARRLSVGGVKAIATNAYVFGYPLVLVDVTQETSTAVAAPRSDSLNAPLNQFAHARGLLGPASMPSVAPSAGMLRSAAWLDLYKEPIVLSIPDLGARYYSMQLMDAWTDVFACPGSRTTGNGRADFAIAGPRWNGALPRGVALIRSPTELVFLVAHTQVNGMRDLAAAHEVQNRYQLTPLGAWGEPYTPPVAQVDSTIDVATPPREQVACMNAATFFGRLNALMRSNPPGAEDGAALRMFETIGIGPGRELDFGFIDSALAEGLAAGAKAGHAAIVAGANYHRGPTVNGWIMPSRNAGNFGTDYVSRAANALLGLGATRAEDALAPHTSVDADGEPLTGDRRYVIRFPTDGLPPVKAFWSISVCQTDASIAASPLDRHSLCSCDELAEDCDGSTAIYLQHDSPGEHWETNWLPVPRGPFAITLGLYWPDQAAIDGRWIVPPIERVP
ncbi:MAG TPA: DUF1254 domain-containing protein [Gammaproteobacteria bacterium]|nr:DUF1254 domain-containing protein [Gammaproteobacteria bacterium]